jgi:hypothetical protein
MVVSLQEEPLCTCTPQPLPAVQFMLSSKFASKPLATPAPTIADSVARIVTLPTTPLLMYSAMLVALVLGTCDSIPQATREPELSCTMKGFPATTVALAVTEKLKEAAPCESVLLYMTVAQGSEPRES